MITVTPSFNNEQKHRNFVSDVSFSSRTDKNKLALYDSTERIFNDGIDRIVTSPYGLLLEEAMALKSELKRTELEMQLLEERRLQLGRLLDYDELRKNGFSGGDVRKFVLEDNNALTQAEFFVAKNTELRERMFGYPANMTEDSAMTKYLRRREIELPLMNNCGDPYDAGNYLMDSKEYEQALLDKLFDHFGLDKSARPWGYITTGGSESNKWGIHNGLRKYPDGRVYYSASAHYSVGKSVKIGFDQDF